MQLNWISTGVQLFLPDFYICVELNLDTVDLKRPSFFSSLIKLNTLDLTLTCKPREHFEI